MDVVEELRKEVRKSLENLLKAGIVEMIVEITEDGMLTLTEKGSIYTEIQLKLWEIQDPEGFNRVCEMVDELSKLSDEELDELLKKKLAEGR